MAVIERMTVVLPEPMAAQLRAAVEAGEYASTSDAMRDAVRLWSERHRLRDLETERLQLAWDAGKASGRHGTLDFEELRREARSRLTAQDNESDRAG